MIEFSYAARDDETGATIKGSRQFAEVSDVMDLIKYIHAMPATRGETKAEPTQQDKPAHHSPAAKAHELRDLVPDWRPIGEILDEEIAHQIDRLDARSNQLRAVVITAVLLKDSGADWVHESLVRSFWSATGQPMPMNLNRDVKLAINEKGWLVSDGRGRIALSEGMRDLLAKPDGYLRKFYRQQSGRG